MYISSVVESQDISLSTNNNYNCIFLIECVIYLNIVTNYMFICIIILE